ncbi:MAG: LacI family transcriptional regulator [Lactobacillus sp.]|nr:LacI family transcriptional regulator [Lactobacillus sp.]
MSTLKDVAQAAGVSESTASRALNGNLRISKKTRDLVKKYADKLNYHPDFAAKNLSRGQSQIIGVIFPLPFKRVKPVDTFHLEILRGINEALDSSDYKIMLVMGRNEQTFFEQVKSMVEEVKVRKFVLLYSAKDDPVIKYLTKLKINFIIIGHPFHHERFVDNDNFKVGQAATQLLLANSQVKRPTFIRTKQTRPFEDDREAGYREIMKQNNLNPEVIMIEDQDEIGNALNHLEGVIFSDDRIFLYCAREVLKYNLPTVCFNESELVKLIFDQEKIINLQPQLLGKKAIELLFKPHITHYFVPYRIEKSKS